MAEFYPGNSGQALICLAFLCEDERFSIPGVDSLASTAAARVGCPLTPVSVAGVAR
jgi:hypothetical protein